MSRLASTSPLALAALLSAGAATAQTTMAPLATFGTAGWLAPGTSAFLGTGSLERGLAYNPATGNLVLVSRNGGNHVRVLNGATGADLGGLDVTGVVGGTYAVNMVGVADDGAIYVGNLQVAATGNFKIYRWNDEVTGFATSPTVVYDAVSGLARIGDSFAVTGAGAAAQFAAAGSTNVAASNFVVGPLDGSNASTPYLSIPNTVTTSNDYRLSLAFVDGDTLIGNQGTLARYTDFGGVSATVQASIPLGAAQRALDHVLIGNVRCLAVIDSNSSLVSVFDISVPGSPVLLAAANATTGTLTSNTNATGSVAWGAVSGNTATLYAMNSNQGIQAFTVTVQPAAIAQPYGSGCGSPALTLAASGAPLLPSAITITAGNLPTTAVVGTFVFGLFPIQFGQPIPTATGCLEYVQPLASSYFLPQGAVSVPLSQTYPNDPVFAGLDIYVQAAIIDPLTGILSTNGLRLYLQTF